MTTTQKLVCPTCVGMNRNKEVINIWQLSMPHMRGDEPIRNDALLDIAAYAPHAWG